MNQLPDKCRNATVLEKLETSYQIYWNKAVNISPGKYTKLMGRNLRILSPQ